MKNVNGKTKFPNSFLNTYPNHQKQVISPENYIDFISY